MKHQWLTWAQEIQSIAQAGLEYSENPFDLERYRRLRELSVEIVAGHTDVELTKVRDLFAGERGYQTPKVDVRAVVFDGDRLLFVKERDGFWALPGGWAETNLTLSENVRKECLEEAGADVAPRRLIAVLDRNHHVDDGYPYSVYKIFVECAYNGGSHRRNIETSDAQFFEERSLPPLSEGRNTPGQVDMCFRYRRGEVPTASFD